MVNTVAARGRRPPARSGRRPGPRTGAASLDSRAELIAAAAAEFAARGYAGASVDRIARAARLTKAMIYYHFGSKLELYRAIVRDAFDAVASAVTAVAEGPGDAAERLDAFIEVFARELRARPHFGSLWMREVIEGVRHVDDRSVKSLIVVPTMFARILADGRGSGSFAAVNPLTAYMAMLAPLVLLSISGPLRARLGRAGFSPAAAITDTDMIDHVRRSLHGLLRVDDSTPRVSPWRQ